MYDLKNSNSGRLNEIQITDRGTKKLICKEHVHIITIVNHLRKNKKESFQQNRH